MGQNSTEVAYGFGQMGSIFNTGGNGNIVSANAVVDAPGVGAEALFVAITFIEDTVFNSSNTAGLVPSVSQLYPSTTTTELSTSIDGNGGVVVDDVVFPAGLTIYGRWTKFQLTSGAVIAYVGY
jgi:hypothetical protein